MRRMKTPFAAEGACGDAVVSGLARGHRAWTGRQAARTFGTGRRRQGKATASRSNDGSPYSFTL